MTTLQERVANERRRLRNVRMRMVAAVEEKANGDSAFVEFYASAADYIDETMQRLHLQDVKMGDMIRQKVERVDESVEEALQQLQDRLDGAEAHLKPFLAARDALREKGVDALADFEREAKIYSDFIVANMGHHGATADLGAKLFSVQDWEYMAGVSDEQSARDLELYERVVAATPDRVPEVS